MKLKHQLFSIIAISGILGANSAPLTPTEALSRIENHSTRRAAVLSGNCPQLLSTITNASGEAAIYVFTYSGDTGFMLLPADDSVVPLIGYSETGTFSMQNMPDNLKSWMDFYVEGIERARISGEGYVPVKTRAQDWEAVAPMIKTTWDQTSPYNNECPLVGNRRTVTGCVATAMAQVMNYWQYPAVGKGSITYRPEAVDTDLSMDFSATQFDWENMQDSYKGTNYSSRTAHAVATLMKACGYSVKMQYTTYESGAFAKDIPSALINYFGYDQGVSRKERSAFSNQEDWNKEVYDNLKTIGPVLYNGQSSSGAHCFVCDGYDGNGLFHINWGWGGLSDGYFVLNELTPPAVGTGGHYGGYNIYQGIVTGIMPPVGRLTLEDIYIGNAASDSGNVKGWGYTYRINDFSNIVLSVDVKISGGHVSAPLYYTIYETDPETKKNGNIMLEGEFDNPLNAGEGETTCETRIRMNNFDPAQLYTLNVAYELKGQRTVIGSIRLAASSGVEDIADGGGLRIYCNGDILTADGASKIEVWDTSGRLSAQKSGNGESVSVSGLLKGLYIVKAYGRNNSSITRKIVIK